MSEISITQYPALGIISDTAKDLEHHSYAGKILDRMIEDGATPIWINDNLHIVFGSDDSGYEITMTFTQAEIDRARTSKA